MTKKKIKSLFKFRRQTFAVPYMAFLLIFIVTPLALILVNAFLEDGQLTFNNFISFFSDGASLKVLGESLIIGLITTVICLLVGYPVAYFLVKYNMGKILVLLFIMPMWVNFLLRTLATKAIFENFLGVGLGYGTVLFGMVYNYLPYMILPLHTAISSIDKSYMEAAEDLGASPFKVFISTTIPLSLSGIISGITMVFVPTISTFAISELLSYNQVLLFGDSINYKFSHGLYGVGSVMSIIMLIFVFLSNFLINKFSDGDGKGVKNLW